MNIRQPGLCGCEEVVTLTKMQVYKRTSPRALRLRQSSERRMAAQPKGSPLVTHRMEPSPSELLGRSWEVWQVDAQLREAQFSSESSWLSPATSSSSSGPSVMLGSLEHCR